MVNGFPITPALLCFHLKANGVSILCLNYLLNPSDRQNVPLCYTLLKEVWSLPDPATSNTPSFIAAWKVLRLLGSLFCHIVVPFIQINLSLHEQLSHLSAAAHLAMFLYTVNNAWNKALQMLTFHDIILLIKNAFFCIAKSKVNIPDGKFWIILLGTDWLESTFGLVWSMVGNDWNVDMLQLGTWLSMLLNALTFSRYILTGIMVRNALNFLLLRMETGTSLQRLTISTQIHGKVMLDWPVYSQWHPGIVVTKW